MLDILRRFWFGRSRSHRVVHTALVAMLSRATSILGAFITIPMIVSYLGPDRYGLWMTLSSLVVWLALADGGVTIGLIALVSHAHGTDDSMRIRMLFSAAYAVTAGTFAVLLFMTVTGPRLVDWRWALGISDPSLQGEATSIMTIMLGFTALGFPAAVVRQGRAGLQQGAAANLWDLAATLLTIGGQFAAVGFQLGLVAVATVTIATRTVVNAVVSIAFLAGEGRDLRPDWRLVNWNTCRTLLGSGVVFTVLTVSQALAVQLDQILIARLIGVGAVADYSIIQKFFALPQMVTTMFLAAQFAAYGEALTRGDYEWIRHHLTWSIIGASVFGVLVCASLGMLIEPILNLWIGAVIRPSPSLVLSMATYGVVATVANVFTYFFFAITLYWRVILAHLAMVTINLPLALYLIPRIGSAGAIIATTCGYVLALVIPSLFAIPGVLRDLPASRIKITRT